MCFIFLFSQFFHQLAFKFSFFFLCIILILMFKLHFCCVYLTMTIQHGQRWIYKGMQAKNINQSTEIYDVRRRRNRQPDFQFCTRFLVQTYEYIYIYITTVLCVIEWFALLNESNVWYTLCKRCQRLHGYTEIALYGLLETHLCVSLYLFNVTFACVGVFFVPFFYRVRPIFVYAIIHISFRQPSVCIIVRFIMYPSVGNFQTIECPFISFSFDAKWQLERWNEFDEQLNTFFVRWMYFTEKNLISKMHI